MIKKTQTSYADKGPAHCGQFSSGFHSSGKYRYLTGNKRWKKNKTAELPKFENKIKIDIKKFPILSSFFDN